MKGMFPKQWHIAMACLAGCLLTACSGARYVDRKGVSDRVAANTGHTLTQQKTAGRFDLPPDVDLSDGLGEAEAVSLALWNNAQFQTDLADLQLASADVTTARIIQNPLLRYLAPNGTVQPSGYINFAIDFIWQRPARIAAAKLNAERVRDSMVQKGFTLIRDAQLAYTDLLLAQQRWSVTHENAVTRAEVNRLAGARLRNGDISELEAATTKADSASAADDLIRAGQAVTAAQIQLNYLLGIMPADTLIRLTPITADTLGAKLEKAAYIELALAYRPDIQAAKTGIAAAGKSLGWERSKIISFTATLNFQYLSNGGESGKNWLPNTSNPGFQAELPIFNRNQGNIQKAAATLEKASFQYYAVLQKAMSEVMQAYNQYEQSYQSYLLWNDNVLPPLATAVELARHTYERGDISYLPVLEAMRQLQNGQLRKAEITAQVRRSVSQLNYSIGQKQSN
ncbi:MAG: TolC family protein [Candidatus Pseudobacter hemicellulosilyticus]|uniref:TolC family protein n=1 Tax=Candidatus Pseudobacter hemicellulosilyticus TaxID=3121375 RepID=A0AAJ5X1G7_9BACT|nr:MAG: TolC family protein [Pseudobacter sp.]